MLPFLTNIEDPVVEWVDVEIDAVSQLGCDRLGDFAPASPLDAV